MPKYSTESPAEELPFPFASLQTIVHNVASRVAGAVGSRLAMVEKGRRDRPPNLATNQDQEAEGILVERLGRLDPGAGFWAEESHNSKPTAERYWVIDPIDGTNNFINSLPLFAVNVGYVSNGVMQAAVTVAPGLGKTWTAQLGSGTHCNGKPVRVIDRDLRMSVLALALQPRDWGQDTITPLERLFGSVRSVRVIGSMALELAWCASGQLDLWLGGGYVWDYWPGKLLVEEAGGIFIEMEVAGQRLRLAGAPKQVEALLDLLGRFGLKALG